jgi:hypothetical protein
MAVHPIAMDSRITSPAWTDSLASSWVASRTISTASLRFSRASPRVAPWVLAPGIYMCYE